MPFTQFDQLRRLIGSATAELSYIQKRRITTLRKWILPPNDLPWPPESEFSLAVKKEDPQEMRHLWDQVLEGNLDQQNYEEITLLADDIFDRVIEDFLTGHEELSDKKLARALTMSIVAENRSAFKKLLNIKVARLDSAEDEIYFWPHLFKEMLLSDICLELFTALCEIEGFPLQVKGRALFAAIEDADGPVALLLLKSPILSADRKKAMHLLIQMKSIGAIRTAYADMVIEAGDLAEFLLEAVEDGCRPIIQFFAAYGEIPVEGLFLVLQAAERLGDLEIFSLLLDSKAASAAGAIEEVIVKAASIGSSGFIKFLFNRAGIELSPANRTRAVLAAFEHGDMDLATYLLPSSSLHVTELRKVLAAAIRHGGLDVFSEILEESANSLDILSSQDIKELWEALLGKGNMQMLAIFLKLRGKQISYLQRVEGITGFLEKQRSDLLLPLLNDEWFIEPPLGSEILLPIFDEALAEGEGTLLRSIVLRPSIYTWVVNDLIRVRRALEILTGVRCQDSIRVLLESLAAKKYSPRVWESVIYPSLEAAIAAEDAGIVATLLEYGNISEELKKQCLLQAKAFPKITQILSRKRLPHCCRKLSSLFIRICEGTMRRYRERRWCRRRQPQYSGLALLKRTRRPIFGSDVPGLFIDEQHRSFRSVEIEKKNS
jgi:hypothetical protein